MSLPMWDITFTNIRVSSKSVPALKIKCPRSDCGKVAYVDVSWSEPRHAEEAEGEMLGTLIVGRSCTYCFKAARLPE